MSSSHYEDFLHIFNFLIGQISKTHTDTHTKHFYNMMHFDLCHHFLLGYEKH